ncbi:MAG: choice-of-anchor tandem repeat GloVer-containing protein [Candidatus Cybelea sp.]|jgi:uncharacterized repeat protein (TIGR03803 family)
MKLSALGLYGLLAACVSVAACSQTTGLSRLQYAPGIYVAPDRAGRWPSPAAGGDGSYPLASLLDVEGTLYGTTYAGGTGGCRGGCGTVFSVTLDGKEQVLHSFPSGSDGVHPSAALVDLDGTLYGTTRNSDEPRHGGTVFSITTGGTEQLLYLFGHKTNGGKPAASLIDAGGTLYGTTRYGGAQLEGTVFSITTDGTWKELHDFGVGTDGAYPEAPLTDVKGTFYGTTGYGGAYHGGTVFTIAPDGTEQVLHSFGNGTDGKNPSAALIDVGGTLYGTTENGGAYSGSGGCCNGTVFSITPNGTEKVLHSFGGKNGDGFNPLASLLEVKGTLYGTTYYGGTVSRCSGDCGTVFSITPDGTEKVLHSFGTDGQNPTAGLIDVGGTLYGTTARGGEHGSGTVFTITTSGTEKVLYSFHRE